MVVITLIGLISGAIIAQPYIRNTEPDIPAQLQIFLHKMTEKSLLEQRWYGMQTDNDKYRLVTYTQTGWNTSGKKGWIKLPAGMQLELSPLPANAQENDIHLYSSPDGMLSVVSLTLITADGDTVIQGPYAAIE